MTPRAAKIILAIKPSVDSEFIIQTGGVLGAEASVQVQTYGCTMATAALRLLSFHPDAVAILEELRRDTGPNPAFEQMVSGI
jgi:hypothetical protein